MVDKVRSTENHHGLPFGWRLGIITSVIVIVTLGSLTIFQELRDIKQCRADRNLLIKESVTPLKIALERASNPGQIKLILNELKSNYLQQGITDYVVDVRDINGTVIASTDTETGGFSHADRFSTVIDLKSSALPSGSGYLQIEQNSNKLNYEIGQRWMFWVLDLIVTAFCILLSLLLLNHFLFTKPLKRLLEGIRQMKMGYWGGLEINTGAWELRWVSQQFNNLASELEHAIRRLVEAERRAWNLSRNDIYEKKPEISLHVADCSTGTPTEISLTSKHKPDMVTDPLIMAFEEYMWDKCRLLTSSDSQNNETKELAWGMWNVYAIEAERHGLYELRSALEDAAFRVLYPEDYRILNRELQFILPILHDQSDAVIKDLKVNLDKHHVPLTEIHKRIKHAAGIWRKMNEKGLMLNQISDLLAIRIIVPEEDACYQAMDVVHEIFEPRFLRFKDYISQPKKNGYRSIHTSVKYNDHIGFEVQIRTEEMHEQAEWGTPSHWRYKFDSIMTFCGKEGVFCPSWRF